MAPCPPRKPRRPPTPESLANIALHYLARYAASEASLRRVLENRVRRATMSDAAFATDTAKQENLRHVITALIERHRKSGVLNDAAFAAMKVGSLRRAGGSARRITEKLQMKGVESDLIATALRPEDEDPAATERRAARTFAKRRKLGIYRAPPLGPRKIDEETQRRKDYATMARAGYSYDITRQTLGGTTLDNEDVED